MNRDHLEGGVRHLRGRIKTAAGAVRGRAADQLDGAYDQAAGAAQYAYGEARDTVRDLRHGGEHLIRADENRGTTLALVAAVAFGLGWLARPAR